MDATLIDVREYPEYAAGHIEGSKLVPLKTLKMESRAWDKDVRLLLVCRTGRRAEQAKLLLIAEGFREVEVLEGGVEAWRNAGKALSSHSRKPWAMERQVRVAAGSFVLLFVGLGLLLSHWFLVGAALVGAGLVFAGVSDTCMMGSVLGRMPWNRPRQVRA